MPFQLPPDSTLLSVRSGLADAEDFVRQVFGVMHDVQRHGGSVTMRLGITGKGRLPNYRLERASDGAVIDAIDGNTHRSWPEGAQFYGEKNWSSIVMTTEEVRSLVGEIRGRRAQSTSPGPGATLDS